MAIIIGGIAIIIMGGHTIIPIIDAIIIGLMGIILAPIIIHVPITIILALITILALMPTGAGEGSLCKATLLTLFVSSASLRE